MNPKALAELERRCRESESWSLVVMRDGNVVVDRNFGHSDWACNLMSATKSITSIAIGFLLDEGKLKSVDTPIADIFPNYKGKWKDKVTVRQILEHTSGIQLYEDSGLKGFPLNRVASALAAPIVTEPGTSYAYNNRAVDLLSGVVRKLAGVPILSYVEKRLFRPLGITEYYWAMDPDGNSHGCAELHIAPRDMAKIGQLMLNGGVWEGKRLLSEEFVRRATHTNEAMHPEGESLGWLWWICDPTVTLDGSSLDRLRKAKVTGKGVERVRPLLGKTWPSEVEMLKDVYQTIGRDGFLKVTDWQAVNDISVPIDNPERETGFYANGWGGQWILVIPKDRIVAVRTCGSGFHDAEEGSKWEMPDFYRLVRDLYPPTSALGKG